MLVAMIPVILGWQFLLHDYQKQRILSFASPEEHQTASYNAEQSLIAVGSGRLLGRGLGHGVQSQLRFLPERQTDFIYASYAEELGFLSVILLLALYLTLCLALLWRSAVTPDRMMSLYLAGLTTQLIVHIAVNIGMNMGLLPITGITLPFMSYGGSSLLSFALSLGIAERIVIEAKTQPIIIH